MTLLIVGAEPLCNSGRGHNREHSCEINFNLDQWFRICCLKQKFTDARVMGEGRSQKLILSIPFR